MSDSIDTTEAQLTEDPRGWAQRWALELAAARKEVERWHKQGEQIVQRYRDERPTKRNSETRWNLYTADVDTQLAMCFARLPGVDVTRKYADSNDDVARVASTLLERALNCDIEKQADNFKVRLESCIKDRLLPGMAWERHRYAADFEPVPETPAKKGPDGAELAPAIPAGERKASEQVESDYVHWRDVLWSPCRTWDEMRWVAFCVPMSRKELDKRFGKDVVARLSVPLNSKRGSKAQVEDDAKKAHPWSRADVWEIWAKDDRKVYWFVDGCSETLDAKDDPLQLTGFFPCQRPMVAHLTTSSFLPRPPYTVAQDLYEEVDALSTRIRLLVDAIRAAGVYDASNDELKQLLASNRGNEMYPVKNWALLKEKGGLGGAFELLPLAEIANAIISLRDYRREVVDALRQVTGWSDIMRGEATQAGATATEQRVKARSGSVRIQSLQDEVARFVAEGQQIKAEIMGRHFDPQGIVEKANAQALNQHDRQYIQPAVELLKSPAASEYRIAVKSDTMAATDFDMLKSEAVEVVQALGAYFSSVAPVVQAMPATMPFFLEMLQVSMAKLKGGDAYEGILDAAIEAAKKMPPQQQEGDPAAQTKLQVEQMKAQNQREKSQMDLQADLIRTRAETEEKAKQEENQARWNIAEQRMKHALTPPKPVQPVLRRKA